MERLEFHRPGFTLLPAMALLALGLTACTADSPQDHTGSSHTTQSVNTEGTFGPSSGSPAATSTQATASASAAPSSGPESSAHAQQGRLLVRLDAAELPAASVCSGFAQKTDEVLSGGGGLGGAATKIDGLQATGSTEIGLLPGTYNLSISCTDGGKTWEGSKASVPVVRGDSVDLLVELVAKT